VALRRVRLGRGRLLERRRHHHDAAGELLELLGLELHRGARAAGGVTAPERHRQARPPTRTRPRGKMSVEPVDLFFLLCKDAERCRDVRVIVQMAAAGVNGLSLLHVPLSLQRYPCPRCFGPLMLYTVNRNAYPILPPDRDDRQGGGGGAGGD